MILTRHKSADVSSGALSAFLRRAREAVGVSGEVNVLLTSNEHMRRLNRQFRQKDTPTDVLSFSAGPHGHSGEKSAGDLAISIEIARANAERLGHSLEDELKVLMLHGVLHLAGHDHVSDGGEMAAFEERLRRELKLPATLIARTERRSATDRDSNRSRSHRTRGRK